jgi:hypothetical protein
VLEREQEAHVAAPVVARDGELPDTELVQDGEHVARELVLLVAAVRHLRPAEAAEVGADHARVRRDEGDHVAPQVPVLRPAVQHHDRRALARQRYVSAQPAGVNEPVLYACYVRDAVAHRAARYPPRAT